MKTYLEIQVPIRFGEEWFEDLRDVLDDVTVTWQKGFYHITMAFLGRVKDPSVRISALRQMISSVDFPPFTLTLTDVDYRVFRGETVFEIKII